MSNRRRSQSIRVKYAFIKTHRGEFDTAVMCQLLDVSRSGFYQWLRNPLSDHEENLKVHEIQPHTGFGSTVHALSFLRRTSNPPPHETAM